MCVIVIKKENQTIPPQALARMFAKNPDGGGIAWFNGDRSINIRKGLMTLAEIHDVLENEVSNAPAVVHFRIATSGGVTPEMTHPFIVAGRVKKCVALEPVTTKAPVIFHNGVISDYVYGDYSDTCNFVSHLLSSVGSQWAMRRVCGLVSGSRFAFLSPETGKIYEVGSWLDVSFEGETIRCSNSNWNFGHVVKLPQHVHQTTFNTRFKSIGTGGYYYPSNKDYFHYDEDIQDFVLSSGDEVLPDLTEVADVTSLGYEVDIDGSTVRFSWSDISKIQDEYCCSKSCAVRYLTDCRKYGITDDPLVLDSVDVDAALADLSGTGVSVRTADLFGAIRHRGVKGR